MTIPRRGDQLAFDIRHPNGRNEFRALLRLSVMAADPDPVRAVRMWLADKTGLLSSALTPAAHAALDRAHHTAGIEGMLMARSLALVAVSHGEVIGGLTAGPPERVIHHLELTAPDTLRHALTALTEIHTLAVEPAYQRNGVGSALLSRAITTAHTAGADLLYSQITPGHTDLFHRAGLTVHTPATRLRLFRYGIPAIRYPDPDRILVSVNLQDL